MELTPENSTDQSQVTHQQPINPQPTHPQLSNSIGDGERWGSLITGSTMVLMGLSQRSLRGALVALAGGTLAHHGIKGQKSFSESVTEVMDSERTIKVEKTVTINRSAEDLYDFWRKLENLPLFMKHIKSVTQITSTRSHWIANSPSGTSVEWDADIITEKPNQWIAWTSTEDSEIDNSGFVKFKSAPQGHGTELKIVMEYNLPGGVVGAAIAKVLGETPKPQIAEELQRFKMLMETGEIATTEGQSSGRNPDKNSIQ
ncbi:MAG: cyclase [Leptolyngbyaceae cyanobacterium CRU_2_3]|nr:cyclase [Leptolyngbyaceae cyanobacterium CRU_2_3]